MNVALVFPGQGSQRPGMFAAFGEDQTAAKTFDEATDLLGYDPRRHDDESSLQSTVHVQVGLFLCGVASLRALEARGARPELVAGHSVGAFAAGVACGSITFADALGAVLVRAKTMDELYPRGYGMGVCAGIDERNVRSIVDSVRKGDGELYVANVNAQAQIAISGRLDGVDEALEECRRGGARRAERLAVAVPSHCPLMQPVAQAVRGYLSDVTIAPPDLVYASAMRAMITREAQGVRDDLCDGVAHEVRWDRTARLIQELGVRLAVESIPGSVLTDLWEDRDVLRAHAMDGAQLDSSAALVRRYL